MELYETMYSLDEGPNEACHRSEMDRHLRWSDINQEWITPITHIIKMQKIIYRYAPMNITSYH